MAQVSHLRRLVKVPKTHEIDISVASHPFLQPTSILLHFQTATSNVIGLHTNSRTLCIQAPCTVTVCALLPHNWQRSMFFTVASPQTHKQWCDGVTTQLQHHIHTSNGVNSSGWEQFLAITILGDYSRVCSLTGRRLGPV